MNIESPMTTASQVESDAGESLRKSAFKLSVLVMVAALIGLAPTAVFFRRPTFLIVIVAIGATVSFLSFWGEEKTVVRRPGWFECLLATLYSVGVWGFLGIAWLAAYRVIDLVIKLVSLVFPRLHSQAHAIAAISSFLLSAIMASGVAIAIAASVSRRFFSGDVSSRAAYYFRALREQQKTLRYVLMSLSALALMGFVLWRFSSGRGFLFYLGLQFVPYVVVLWLLRFGVRARADSDVFLAVVRLLECVGYKTVISPHSDDMIMDKLLSGVDMIAYDDKCTFIVKVKTQGGSTEPVEWTVASALEDKVKALAFYHLRSPVDLPYLVEHNVKALMVLCGRTADPSLLEFALEEKTHIVTLDMKVIDEVMEAKDDAEVKKLATQYFGFLEEGHEEVLVPQLTLAGQEAKQWHL